MDVIMRNDVVESVRAGDKMVFTGSLVVVPDISAVTAPGERVETRFGARRLRTLLSLPATSSLCREDCWWSRPAPPRHHARPVLAGLRPLLTPEDRTLIPRSTSTVSSARMLHHHTLNRWYRQQRRSDDGLGGDGPEGARRAGADLQAVLHGLLHLGAPLTHHICRILLSSRRQENKEAQPSWPKRVLKS